MYTKVASILIKPEFINVLKTLHKLLNNNENFINDDEIVERINYISHIMNLIKLTDLLKDMEDLDDEIVLKAEISLDNLKNTTDVSTINFISIFNFINTLSKNLNLSIAALVEKNNKSVHDNALIFIKNIIPVIAAYDFK